MNILPPMPYAGAVIFGITLLSVSVILVIFAIYCLAYLRQMVRASLRWRKNLLSAEALPLLPLNPQFKPRTRRAVRTILLWAVLIYAIGFVVGYAFLSYYTQAWEFWHALGWFGYVAP
jgi:polyferredoxin